MLFDTCGHHCGLKDRIERHCPCKDCHNGIREHIIIGYAPAARIHDKPEIPARIGSESDIRDRTLIPDNGHKVWQSLPELLESDRPRMVTPSSGRTPESEINFTNS